MEHRNRYNVHELRLTFGGRLIIPQRELPYEFHNIYFAFVF